MPEISFLIPACARVCVCLCVGVSERETAGYTEKRGWVPVEELPGLYAAATTEAPACRKKSCGHGQVRKALQDALPCLGSSAEDAPLGSGGPALL